MPTTEKLRNKLITKLTELFQLDQPDLDFGFYRIMQAKAQQVKSFIDEDLLKIIEDAFGQVDEGRKVELAAAVEKAIQTAKDFGAPNPEETEPVKKAKAALDALRDGATAESDVYDHLYRFFERYYDEGDFISRRYYARENAGKAAPFAIPYNGEEVKLHWANADQYYIKTAEYFSNYSFDVTQAAEIRNMSGGEKILNGIPEKTLKVHFRIVDASEGEHGNVKAAEDKKRFFILHEKNPVEFNDADELVINFEYKALPGGKNDVDADTEKALKEKFGKSLNKGDMPNLAIAEKVMAAVSGSEKAKEYLSALSLHAPTDKISNRPLLAKYINQYTARNTCDYFIHKDLSGFLKRELDFYIKNEVMHLDDIENADAPAVENYLSKLKVIRKIAAKLIDFLAQLEDFQKKLWLKKKFVTETNYCITLDRIYDNDQLSITNEQKWLLHQVVENKAQWVEWQKLGFVQLTMNNEQLTDEQILNADDFEISFNGEKQKEGDLSAKEPLSYCKLTDNCSLITDHWNLVLDTAFFSSDFKAKLIASIEDFDEQCDGLLIHSENFQALNLLQERYREQVKYIYLDPPYNTNESTFIYKNEYKHSSWASMTSNSINIGSALLRRDGTTSVAIDDLEQPILSSICDNVFGIDGRLGTLVIEIKPSGRTNDNFFATSHEYILYYSPSPSDANISFFELSEEQMNQYAESDDSGAYKWRDFLRTGGYSTPEERPNSFYPIYFNPENSAISLEKADGFIEIFPIDSEGKKRVWRKTPPSFQKHADQNEISVVQNRNGDWKVKIIDRIKTGTRPKSVWVGSKYDASSHGTKLLKKLFGNNSPFSFPKSINAVEDCVFISTDNEEESQIILDYFGGSGTTGHAVINLNRSDNGFRKYSLVEMGDYFDTVTKPRISKIIYSSDWKDGKPASRDTGISQCFKYIRLESYEDTLNNLVFDDNPTRQEAIKRNRSLKEDYMLRYLLDVETRGSQSLLNIDAFADPTAYALTVKKPGSDEQVTQNIDLIETFNYLLGLRLENMAAPQTFTASFTRKPDPELPEDQHTKLVVDGKIRTINKEQLSINRGEDSGHGSLSTDYCKTWWFRKLEGWVPADPMNPNNDQKERVLIVWRKLTGNLEEDNLMLDEWFEKYRISTRDFEYDTIYVNGSNNLPNLKRDDENWKVRLIEEEFHKKMWEVE